MHPIMNNTSTSSKLFEYTSADYVRQYLLHPIVVGSCTYLNDTEIEFEAFENYLLLAVIRGSAQCDFGGKADIARDNELIYASANSLRKISIARGSVLLWIEYSGPAAIGHQRLLEINDGRVFRGELITGLISELRKLAAPCENTPAAQAKITLLLTTVLTNLCATRSDSTVENEEEAVNRLLRNIVNNIADPPSVKEMAAAIGHSQAHFIRMFNRRTGLTPHQYIISIRINRAKHLLATTDLPLRDIANIVGYTSESMFCSAFRNATNITAGEYRSRVAGLGHSKETETLRMVSDAVTNGNTADIVRLCRDALNSEHLPREILDTMMSAMDQVESLYGRSDILLSDMLSSAKVLKRGLISLIPNFSDSDRAGTAIIGTVTGDLHDIGKNLVALMLECIGFEVIDLGVDVPAESFIAAYNEHPDTSVIMISALLLSSRSVMESIVRCLNEQPFRKNVRILVGGGTIDEAFARKIGADAYTDTALHAARTAVNITSGEKQNA